MEKLAIHGGRPVRETPLPYGRQYIDEADILAVTEVLRSDFLTTGPKVGELEEKLCLLTGARYAVAVSSGTAALHGACAVSGLGVGDEVITSPLTFAASANCILYTGAKPVFADIDPDTYNLSPQAVRDCLTPRTKGVIGVDFAGQAADLDGIREICIERGLFLVEDAAHAIGTTYKGAPVGSIADMTTFSFHPVKTVTGGEGGAILTDSEELAGKLRLFRSHGITRDPEMMGKKDEGSWYYEQIALGFNYRLTDIQSALIISQLDKLTAFARRRREIVRQYNEAFADIEGLILPKNSPDSATVPHLYVLQLDTAKLTGSRREIYEALHAENILCNVHYIPVYTMPYYQSLGYSPGLCPQAESLYQRILSIPLHYSMTDEDTNTVITAVKKVLKWYARSAQG